MSDEETEGQDEQHNQLAEFEDDSSPEEMEEAKGLGWKSPAEWKGDPPKNGFKKAKEFLEHGRTVLPIVQSENKKLKEELANARREAATFKTETDKKLENMERMSRAALARQRQQLADKYEELAEAAVEVGDKEAYRKAQKEKQDALQNFDEAVAEKDDGKKEEKKTNALPQEVTDWVSKNPWFEDDDDMKAVAIRKHGELLRSHPDWTLERNLEETRKYVAKRFPSEFEDKGMGGEDQGEDERPARRGSPVEGGGSRMGGGAGRSAWSRLPSEAQKQADRFIKEDGLFLSKGETVEKDLQKARDRYAKEYLGEEAA